MEDLSQLPIDSICQFAILTDTSIMISLTNTKCFLFAREVFIYADNRYTPHHFCALHMRESGAG